MRLHQSGFLFATGVFFSVFASAQAYTITTVAHTGASTTLSGSATPVGLGGGPLAVDSSGNVYIGCGFPVNFPVVDALLNGVVRLGTAGGVSTVATLEFGDYATALALDTSGNLLVGTQLGGLAKVTPDGLSTKITSIAPSPVKGVAVDQAGDIYYGLIDPALPRLMRVESPRQRITGGNLVIGLAVISAGMSTPWISLRKALRSTRAEILA